MFVSMLSGTEIMHNVIARNGVVDTAAYMGVVDGVTYKVIN